MSDFFERKKQELGVELNKIQKKAVGAAIRWRLSTFPQIELRRCKTSSYP